MSYLWELVRDVPDTDDCVEWGHARNEQQYGVVWYLGKKWKVHRLSFAIHRDVIPEGMLICHTCDNPPCFNPRHLFIGTQSDNIQDSVSKGRLFVPTGELHGRALLTETDVIAIRSSYRPNTRGSGYRILGRRYGVSDDTIRCIILRKSWEHI